VDVNNAQLFLRISEVLIVASKPELSHLKIFDCCLDIVDLVSNVTHLRQSLILLYEGWLKKIGYMASYFALKRKPLFFAEVLVLLIAKASNRTRKHNRLSAISSGVFDIWRISSDSWLPHHTC
jgi:hypothetical protein